MSGKLISVVIPTYNRADFIRKTIDSLLAQSNSHFEIIVVDDGSTDNTEEVVKSIDDKRIRYYKKENAERAAARNYGSRLAKGDYVNFFDSDDIAYANHLEEAINAIDKFNAPELFHLNYDVKDADGKLIRTAGPWDATINKSLITGNHLSCNCVFVRHDIALQYPFDETRALSASEDFELWLRLAARFRIYSVNAITSTLVNHESRSVLKINAETFVARIEQLKLSLSKDLAFMSYYGSQVHILNSYLNIYVALHLAMAQYPKKDSFRCLFRAAKDWPLVIFSRRFLAALRVTLK